MRYDNYGCDMGSLAIACGESVILFPNGSGDGFHRVYLFDNEKEFYEWAKEKRGTSDISKFYHFITTCRFKDAEVLDDDCAQLDDEGIKRKWNPVFVLNGRYAIYCSNYNGNMFIVKYE